MSCCVKRKQWEHLAPCLLPIPHAQLPITNYQCPIPHAQLPITNYQCPIPHAQLPITNYQCPIPHAQLPITNYQLPITNFNQLLQEFCQIGSFRRNI